MLARCLGCALLLERIGRRDQRLSLALCLDFFAADAGLQLKQIQLQIAEFLARLAILGDASQTQTLFQQLNFQLRIL